VGASTSEETIGEEEERMIDVADEFILEERLATPTEEGVSPDRDVDDKGDILMTQIPSIDTLLHDIYELRY